MNCADARAAIVLEERRSSTERHVAGCSDCREFVAAGFAPMPLRDGDFAAVRARVLAQLNESRRPRRFAFVLGAAAASLIVVAGLLLRVRRETPVAIATPSLPAAPHIVAAPAVAAISKPSRIATRSKTHHRVRAARVGQRPEPEMRIELQTDDPDIRIIWIVNPQPLQPEESDETR